MSSLKLRRGAANLGGIALLLILVLAGWNVWLEMRLRTANAKGKALTEWIGKATGPADDQPWDYGLTRWLIDLKNTVSKHIDDEAAHKPGQAPHQHLDPPPPPGW